MTYRIYFTLRDGSDDSIVVAADTIEELRERAFAEIEKRGGSNPWSEKVGP